MGPLDRQVSTIFTYLKRLCVIFTGRLYRYLYRDIYLYRNMQLRDETNCLPLKTEAGVTLPNNRSSLSECHPEASLPPPTYPASEVVR